ncbi:hypothetical protein PR202_ga20245 [Eleusine coracana subsp. coracana]|uniref:Ty3 transposon capsid-like protein domain-containing protein n=1 Tax=Eleusine coracana subsp. coracana TaxID=191504 RepID=A0AAV5CY83_ELECO|nr:hypothetical protein PR202_ga20245 [Eleusine coracana subsp. coracana]
MDVAAKRLDDQRTADDERWSQFLDSLDLLFAKMVTLENRIDDIDDDQQRVMARLELNSRALERTARDQHLLAQRVDANGDELERLTRGPERRHDYGRFPRPRAGGGSGSDADDDAASFHNIFARRGAVPHGARNAGLGVGGGGFGGVGGGGFGGVGGGRPGGLGGGRRVPREAHAECAMNGRNRVPRDDRARRRHNLPKMSFPKFDGTDPVVWGDKCLDYFELFSIPEYMWVTSACLHMEGNAAKWLQVFKKQHELVSWDQFMAAVHTKFGAFDYHKHMRELLALRQTSSVEDYAAEFESLRYMVAMHNTAMDETFFVSQFVKGLKEGIREGVQAQIPETVERAVLLAQIQQETQERHKYRPSKPANTAKPGSTPKLDNKHSAGSSEYWKERQLRDYRRANNLCYFCGDKLTMCILRSVPNDQKLSCTI